ncbi:MAG: transcriptional repressor [Candidatus Krumholzibacteriota bacterium]|nr:transcriptional repressor [Candidatus Krumholzibacteriota bacterium]
MGKIKSFLEKECVSLTPQRLAIIEFLEGNESHPTVDEIYTNVKSLYPTISKATVYSVLELLSDLGVIKELSIRKRGEACFDPSTVLHHHFHCRKCDTVIDIDVDSYDESTILDTVDSLGHKVEDIQLYIYGICRDCIDKNT